MRTCSWSASLLLSTVISLLSKAEQKRFRSLMWPFRRDPKDLKPEERAALEELFTKLPVLKDVYDVQVRFKDIFDTAPVASGRFSVLRSRREVLIASAQNLLIP